MFSLLYIDIDNWEMGSSSPSGVLAREQGVLDFTEVELRGKGRIKQHILPKTHSP